VSEDGLLTVRELAGELGYRWVEKDLQPYDGVNVDEALRTATGKSRP
jgi:hypothetical protein